MNDNDITEKIADFNKQIKEKQDYCENRSVLSTAFIGNDDFSHISPEFIKDEILWCQIDFELEHLIKNFNRYIKSRLANSNALPIDEIKEIWNKNSVDIIKKLLFDNTRLFLSYLKRFIQEFDNILTPFYKSNYEKIEFEFNDTPDAIFNSKKIIKDICKKMSLVSEKCRYSSKLSKKQKKYKKILAKIEPLLATNTYSNREIIKILKIKKSTFYSVLRNIDNIRNFEKGLFQKKCVKSYIKTDEFKDIFDLAVDKEKSRTCKEICEEMHKKHGVVIKPSNLLYHLKNTLNLTYKLNSYYEPRYYYYSERQSRFLTAVTFLSDLQENIEIISLDETSIDISIKRERGFSLKGEKSIRVSPGVTKRFSMIMAISKHEIIGYTIR